MAEDEERTLMDILRSRDEDAIGAVLLHCGAWSPDLRGGAARRSAETLTESWMSFAETALNTNNEDVEDMALDLFLKEIRATASLLNSWAAKIEHRAKRDALNRYERRDLPEEALIAILHRTVKGYPDHLIEDDRAFFNIFDQGAKKHPKLLGDYAFDPNYSNSGALIEALHVLSVSDVIIRHDYCSFSIGERTVGDYGESVFKSFSIEDREFIDNIAVQLRAACLM